MKICSLINWETRRSFGLYSKVLKKKSIDNPIVDTETHIPLHLNQHNITKHFDISYARSSGAGGQHVNTTDSKAIIKLPAHKWFSARDNWIPSKYFDVIMLNLRDDSTPTFKKFPYFTQSGDIIISSSNTRYRDKNLDECFKKFIDAVKICSEGKQEISQDTRQRWDKLKKRENEGRLEEKRLKKDKKSFRKKVNFNDY